MKDNNQMIKLIIEINETKKELDELNKQRNHLKSKVETDSGKENILLVKYLEHRYKKLEEKSKRLLEESKKLNQSNNLNKGDF